MSFCQKKYGYWLIYAEVNVEGSEYCGGQKYPKCIKRHMHSIFEYLYKYIFKEMYM